MDFLPQPSIFIPDIDTVRLTKELDFLCYGIETFDDQQTILEMLTLSESGDHDVYYYVYSILFSDFLRLHVPIAVLTRLGHLFMNVHLWRNHENSHYSYYDLHLAWKDLNQVLKDYLPPKTSIVINMKYKNFDVIILRQESIKTMASKIFNHFLNTKFPNSHRDCIEHKREMDSNYEKIKKGKDIFVEPILPPKPDQASIPPIKQSIHYVLTEGQLIETDRHKVDAIFKKSSIPYPMHYKVGILSHNAPDPMNSTDNWTANHWNFRLHYLESLYSQAVTATSEQFVDNYDHPVMKDIRWIITRYGRSPLPTRSLTYAERKEQKRLERIEAKREKEVRGWLLDPTDDRCGYF